MGSETYDCIFKVLLLGDSGVGKSSTLLRFVDEDFKEQHHSTIGVEFGSKIVHYQDRLDIKFPGFETKRIKLQVWDTAGQERFRSVTKSYFRGTAGIIMVFDITNRKSFNSLQYWLQELEHVRGSSIDASLLEEDSGLQEDPKITYTEVYKKVPSSKMNEVQIDMNYTNDSYKSQEEDISYSLSDTDDSDDLAECPHESCSSSEDEKEEDINKNIQIQRFLDPIEFLHVRYPPIVLVGNKVDLSNEDREVYADEAIQFAKENHFDYYIETSALTGNHVEEVFSNLAKTIYSNVKRRGTGLDGVISPKHHNPTWYELEVYRRRNGCSC